MESLLNFNGNIDKNIRQLLEQPTIRMAVPIAALSFTSSKPRPPFAGTHGTTATTAAAANRRSFGTIRAMKMEKPLEVLYNVRVEREVSKERLEELGVQRWSMWKTGKCKFPWDWHVDQLVYIEEGEVRVVPDGSERFMSVTVLGLTAMTKAKAIEFKLENYRRQYRCGARKPFELRRRMGLGFGGHPRPASESTVMISKDLSLGGRPRSLFTGTIKEDGGVTAADLVWEES
ncbi:hypothetical protein NE237_016252 [Protea cynaroides]|uniref:(S)-ureidoglycine aminohydrolase cupin domain-containing protein n=1 Tax=Protea cynaroides TaxID=273540 RepID=A0A9Q0KFI1_9MAGN|nr:hypothetical protein NE237_016252 [Protea cynaroides]